MHHYIFMTLNKVVAVTLTCNIYQSGFYLEAGVLVVHILWCIIICKLHCAVWLGLGLGLRSRICKLRMHDFRTARCNLQIVQLHKSYTTCL